MKFFEKDADLLVTKTLSLSGGDVERKRAEIREYFHKTFSLDEKLFDCLAVRKASILKQIPCGTP